MKMIKTKIVVAGNGMCWLSIAVLLSHHSKVTAIDVIKEKVYLINNKASPIFDTEISKYFANNNF